METISRAIAFLLGATCLLVIGYVAGAGHPDDITRDAIVCGDRCEQRGEKFAALVKRECICETSRIALPGRSGQ
jgi:hypothetical protein